MAIMAMDTAQKNSVRAVCLALFCSKFAFAGEWQFTPSIDVDETYTDNVRLTPVNEESSLVSQAKLLIESSYEAQHTSFNFGSESTYAFYSHDHELDSDYHNLNSDFRFQLWPNGITLTGSAVIANQSQNSSRNALADIVSADTVRVETYNGGIEYRVHNSDFIFNSGIGYQITESEDDIGNREGVVAQFDSNNGAAARYIFWDIEHKYQELKNDNNDGELTESEVKIGFITDIKVNPFIRYYDESNKGNVNSANRAIESDSYGAGIRWLVSPRLYIDASYNKPIGDSLDLDGNEQKEYVNALIKWQPSSRTSLEASFSERFYGDSYGLDFSHRNKRLTNNITYSESVQTLTRNNYVPEVIGLFWCPANTTINSIADCLVQNGDNIIPENYQLSSLSQFNLVEDNVFSLNKDLSWRSELELPRTSFILDAGIEKRENLDNRIKDENSKVSFSVSRKISGKSNLNLVLSYTRTNLQLDTPQERKDQYRRYKISYQKSLNSKLSFDVELSYLDRSSSDLTLNYEEGRVSAKITKGF